MNISSEYEGRVAFITGGGSGIGRASALAFAEQGARVAVVDRMIAAANETAERVRALGVDCVPLEADVTREPEVAAAVAATVHAFGRLDYAFNNAGVEQPASTVAETDTAEWNRIIGVNLSGVFFGMKHQIPEILRGGGGAIVNTSSGAGVVGIARQGAYAASKWGVIGLSKSAALEYAAQNVRINVIAPGIIDTPMMDRFSGGTEEGRARVVAQEPVGRMGRPAEIAAAVLWLCSDLASFTVGHAYVMDGGQTVGF
ncbi:glucose 1-dehydrogenase [Microbacterium sp. DT81.1]|uniref:glucose 1-dehydrogenase n=1 Tax=Microbacterium sp. DT81.1 TaxID=3393413 RepID=UPI003CE95506